MTNAFLVTRIIDFKKSQGNQVVARNGNFSEFVPFTVIENRLLSNSLHYNMGELYDNIPSEKAGKWLAKNKGKYPAPPDEFSKLSSLRIVSITFIIPFIKGAKIAEGSIEDSTVVSKLAAYHGAAAEWLCLINMESRCSSKLWCGDIRNNVPERCGISTTYEIDLFIKVLMEASKNSIAYRTVRNLVDNFKAAKVKRYNQDHSEEIETVPKSIDLDYNSKCSKFTNVSSVKSSSSIDTKVMEKNTLLLSFFQILFCREGSGEDLIPGTMSDEAMEIIVSSDKIAEQARLTADNITALTDEIGNERSYISRYNRFPFLSHTCITYVLQAHFHNGAIDYNLDSLKKSFSLLNLLALPHDCNDELTSFTNSSRNVEVEQMLDQLAEKRAGIRKEVFLRGR